MSTTDRITQTRALQIVEAYGGDPDTWPRGERAAVIALSQSSPAVSESIARARRLDALLAEDAIPDMPAGLAERLQPPARLAGAADKGRLRLGFGGRLPAYAVAATLCLGVFVGFIGDRAAVSPYSNSETLIAAALSGAESSFLSYTETPEEGA